MRGEMALMLRPLVAIGCIVASAAAVAEPARLSGEAIKKTLVGGVLEFDTPVGTKIPVRITGDGLVSGQAGALAAYLGAARDRGRWWIADDRLCVKWFRWFDAEARCLDIRQDGERLFWREQGGKTGTATITERPQLVVKAPRPVLAERPAKAPAATTREAASDEKPVRYAGMALLGVTPAHAAARPESEPASDPRDRDGLTSAQDAPRAVEPSQVTPPPRPREAASEDAPAAKKEAPAAKATPSGQAVVSVEVPIRKPAHSVALQSGPTPAHRPADAFEDEPLDDGVMTFRVARVEDDDVLNVRSGPSEYYERVGNIPPQGRGVRIVGECRAYWCPISHGDVSGWVNRYYLAAEDARADESRWPGAR